MNDFISEGKITRHLINLYRMDCQKEWFEKTFYETMKIRKELSLNSTLKKILLAQETIDALEAEYFSRVRIDLKNSETTATLYGIPVEVDGSIAPGNIGYVIEVKM